MLIGVHCPAVKVQHCVCAHTLGEDAGVQGPRFRLGEILAEDPRPGHSLADLHLLAIALQCQRQKPFDPISESLQGLFAWLLQLLHFGALLDVVCGFGG